MAEKYNGEIINGDALQMYEGLPIATNKLPLPERKSIPHHLLGCVKWNEEPWTVGKYVAAASEVVRNIAARGKLPIIVGGTHYYIQSLLFERSLVNTDVEHQTAEVQEKKWPMLAGSTDDMLDELRKIDPEEASRWHPNDRRKIRHSLELYLTSGRKPSDIYRDQRTTIATSSASDGVQTEHSGLKAALIQDATPPLRFNPLILWIYADLDKLSTRLTSRVDTMVAAGLVEEVESMQRLLEEQKQSGIQVDQTTGIWSAIGFKELLSYVSASQTGDLKIGDLERMKAQGIEKIRIATRQYARQQQRWIRGKLLRALEEHSALDRILLLNGTELLLWPHNVEEIASTVVSAFLKGEPHPKTSTTSDLKGDVLVPNTKAGIKARYCEICDMTLMTQKEWNAHPKSKKHRRATRTAIDWQALYPKSQGQAKKPSAGSIPDKE